MLSKKQSLERLPPSLDLVSSHHRTRDVPVISPESSCPTKRVWTNGADSICLGVCS